MAAMTVLVITVPLVLLIAVALTALVVREFATRGRRRVVGALVERAELLRFEAANLDLVRLRLSAAEQVLPDDRLRHQLTAQATLAQCEAHWREGSTTDAEVRTTADRILASGPVRAWWAEIGRSHGPLTADLPGRRFHQLVDSSYTDMPPAPTQ